MSWHEEKWLKHFRYVKLPQSYMGEKATIAHFRSVIITLDDGNNLKKYVLTAKIPLHRKVILDNPDAFKLRKGLILEVVDLKVAANVLEKLSSEGQSPRLELTEAITYSQDNFINLLEGELRYARSRNWTRIT